MSVPEVFSAVKYRKAEHIPYLVTKAEVNLSHGAFFYNLRMITAKL